MAWFGRRVMPKWQRLVRWAQAPPTAGAVQAWYARLVHLLGQYRPRKDEAGTLARTLEQEFSALWTFVVEEGVERILSLRETCRLRNLRTFPVLVEAVTCYFSGQHPDVSWI